MGTVYLRGRVWWIQYFQNGTPRRESSRSIVKSKARKLLAVREAQVIEGKLPELQTRKVTLEEIFQDLEIEYTNNGRVMERLKIAKKHILKFLGKDSLAKTLDGSKIQNYINDRVKNNISLPTVNRELNCLKRGLNLARRSGKVGNVPFIPKYKESAPRTGFIGREEYNRLFKEMPDYLKPALALAFFCGMRRGEILGLQWKDIDFMEGKITLPGMQTKNGEPRTIYLSQELKTLLEMEHAWRTLHYPNSPFVCAKHGKGIADFSCSWEKACKKAGLENLLFHDLRRSAVRNLVRSGVNERVAMAISGHKTRAVYDRYNIVSEDDLRQASKKLEGYLEETATKPLQDVESIN